MPWLMYLLAPGFADTPEKFDLAVRLTQITFPYLLCMSLVALMSGVLNTLGRFVESSSVSIVLNTVLTVEAGMAHSHAKLGWEQFTDRVIAALNAERSGIVFLLWGSHAQKKGQIIDRQRHHVLMAPHPSPLSAHRGFLGCGHFSETNRLLQAQGLPAIEWQLPLTS